MRWLLYCSTLVLILLVFYFVWCIMHARLSFLYWIIVVLFLFFSKVQLWGLCFILCTWFCFILDGVPTELLLYEDKLEDFWIVLILFILVYWSFRFFPLVPVCLPICIALSFCTLLLLSFEIVFTFRILDDFFKDNCSLFTIYLLFWIDRDLIFLIFSLIFPSSLFLVPEVVFSTFLFINLIYVAINVLLLPLLMFLIFLPRSMIFLSPVLIFFLTWSYLNLIVYYWYFYFYEYLLWCHRYYRRCAHYIRDIFIFESGI